MRVAILTCLRLPEPDPDQQLLLDALSAAGMAPSMLAWDDPEADPGRFDVCVIRSTWNYIHSLDAFLAWMERAGAQSQLFNPSEIVRENVHKGYLRMLEREGVPIVPTAWVERGAARPVAEVCAELGAKDVVIKPAVSAGSFRTRRFQAEAGEGEAAAQAFLEELAGHGDVMIQPWLASVDGHGERALVWIDGAVTHAVRKSPRFAEEHEAVSAALEPTAEERRFAEQVIAPFASRLLYGRIDVMWDDRGAMCVSELELVEPSLFLRQHPPALERLVEGIARRGR